MAQYYARIHGSRGPASRLGCVKSGMNVNVKSWEGEITVAMVRRRHQGELVDWVTVELGPHSGTYGGADSTPITLYSGPCGGWRGYRARGELSRIIWHAEHEAKVEA